MDLIKKHLQEAKLVLDKFLNDNDNLLNIQDAGNLMVEAIQRGNKIISCGNGGSMSDAMHFAEELTGKFRNERKALPAISISDPTHISCTANDYGYEFIFSRFIEGLGNEGDILLAISTSGNSENILKAIKAAKEKRLSVIGLSGKGGGKMANICDVEIRAPQTEFSDRTQEIHIKILHVLIDYIERKLELGS